MNNKFNCLLLILLSCLINLNQKDKHDILFEETFLQKETNYSVLFYLDSCLACRNSKLFLLEKEKRENRKVYFVNFLNCNFISKNENLINVSSYKELYIKVVPTLLIIEKQQISSYIIGYQEIIKTY